MMHIVERGQTKMRYELWPSFELPTRRRLGDGALLIGTEGKGARRNLANDERLASPLLSFPLRYLLVPEGGSRSELISLPLIIALSLQRPVCPLACNA